MAKHRAVIVGAGRIGAGYKWDQDINYTHAGAYLALKERVELVGFVEPDHERADAASAKWGLDWRKTIAEAVDFWKPDIVSICTRDDDHAKTFVEVLKAYEPCQDLLKGVWMEKPFPIKGDDAFPIPVQVNYQRRGDPRHRLIAGCPTEGSELFVYGKDDETTRCHFRDLARFWKTKLIYRVHDGPCAYLLDDHDYDGLHWFDGGNGGVDSAEAFKAMLGNLLDHLDHGTELWSPPYVE